jgi:hypothetical protein
MLLLKNSFKRTIFIILTLIVITLLLAVLTACRKSDGEFDMVYFFKTEPEKAVLDFLYALDNKDPDYIYTNLLPDKDKNNISREKYTEELNKILYTVEKIDIIRITYLGYEGDIGKVVAEFKVSYTSGEVNQYKKYIYLTEEGNKWKILFEKTFI